MTKNILIVIFSFLAINSFSQEAAKKMQFYGINTKDIFLDKEEEVIINKALFLIKSDSNATTEFEKKTYTLNYKVAEDGKITFVKGHKGFPKAEIPYELTGIHFRDYENDEIIRKFNDFVTNIKVIHHVSREKQPDCKKLKNVIFYGDIKVETISKKA